MDSGDFKQPIPEELYTSFWNDEHAFPEVLYNRQPAASQYFQVLLVSHLPGTVVLPHRDVLVGIKALNGDPIGRVNDSVEDSVSQW